MEHLVRMLPMMTASRSVQVPDSHRGMRIPAEGEESGTACLKLQQAEPRDTGLSPFYPRTHLTAGNNSSSTSCRYRGRSISLPRNEPQTPSGCQTRPRSDPRQFVTRHQPPKEPKCLPALAGSTRVSLRHASPFHPECRKRAPGALEAASSAEAESLHLLHISSSPLSPQGHTTQAGHSALSH